MSVLVTSDGVVVRARPSADRLRGALLWLTGLAGGFVLVEPSPYEAVALATMVLFAFTGLSLRPALSPLIVLLLLLNAGYTIALMPVLDAPGAAMWVLVSVFLSLTAIFFAAMLGTNTKARLDWLMRGTTLAALIASALAIAGYFHLLGSFGDLFVLYDRARGTFKDPNVLGAFLVLPGLLALQRVLIGRLRSAIPSGVTLVVILAALFLTFSRGAWGQFLIAALVMTALTFITSRSNKERVRLVMLALVGMVAVVAFIAALLSIGKVADLFSARASLDQSYDLGPMGRFGRYFLGAELALDNPLGLGPMQFPRLLPEAPHNVYLNAFMSGGWLSGFAYLTLTAITLVMGLRYLLRATPWQPTYHAVYAAYVGVVFESAVIDSDHWRHYFLILGVLWGLMAVTRTWRASDVAERPPDRTSSHMIPRTAPR